ncbi:hypothetical protein [Xanthomonas medicagonis]|uniref:hypothetical protein n=1 Tax=Xanthomonas medicagonis TaxID=3160841 RepID=UPI0035140546
MFGLSRGKAPSWHPDDLAILVRFWPSADRALAPSSVRAGTGAGKDGVGPTSGEVDLTVAVYS